MSEMSISTRTFYVTQHYRDKNYDDIKDILRSKYGLRINYLDDKSLFCLSAQERPDIWTKENTPILMENRGTIYDSSFKPVSMSLEKFWSYDHPMSQRDKMIWDTSKIKIFEKYDGYLMKVFYHGGKFHVSTNSKIDSSNVVLRNSTMNAHDVFMECADNSNFSFDKLDKNNTYIFEMMHPNAKIIIQYNEPKLIHIGTRSNITFQEIEVDIGVKKPAEFSDLYPHIVIENEEQLIEHVKGLHFTDREGFIVKDENGLRIKYKSPDYKIEHTLMETTPKNEERIFKTYIVNKFFSSRNNRVPDVRTFHPDSILSKMADELEARINEINLMISELCIEEDRKEFMKKMYSKKLGSDIESIAKDVHSGRSFNDVIKDKKQNGKYRFVQFVTSLLD